MDGLALILQQEPNPNPAFHTLAIVLGVYAIVIFLGVIAVIIPCWFICKKAGFSPWLAFLNLMFPIGGLILLYVLAFADWNVLPAPQPYWPPPPQPPYSPAPPKG
jgi:hypothetical protein